MDDTFWQKQILDKPLFEDLLWSRPENKRSRGKLLIAGGNAHGFMAPAAAYTAAVKAGAGTTRVVLPDVLQKAVGSSFPEAQFAPSTPSGSFARLALATLLQESAWADGTLLAGDFGRNSETALALESFLDQSPGLLIAADDSIDPLIRDPAKLLLRPKTYLVIDLPRLQKLSQAYDPRILVRHSMSLAGLVGVLVDGTSKLEALIVTEHHDHFIVARKGRVSTTPTANKALGPEIAAGIAVWALQQPTKPFEAATTAIHETIGA